MRKQVFQGFLAAAATPVPFGCLGAICLAVWAGGNRADAFFFVVLLGALSSMIAGVLVTAALGVPTYLLLNILNRRSLASYLVAGAMISAIAGGLLLLDEWLGHKPNPAQLVLGRISQTVAFVSGPVAAWIFWRIARPDRVQAAADRGPEVTSTLT